MIMRDKPGMVTARGATPKETHETMIWLRVARVANVCTKLKLI